MLRHILAVLIILPATAVAALCEDQDDPLPAPIQDPSLATSVYFPPALITKGIANTGPALSLAKPGGSKCTVLMPCAVTSPALDHAVIARPTP